MRPITTRLRCPICGGDIDKLTNVDTIKNEYPVRKLICLNKYQAHYEIAGETNLLAQYKNNRNFEYTLYLGLN